MKVGKHEIEQGADLRYADLRGADLRDANLQDASLQGANLQGADLRYADLQDANLQDANLQGANLLKANLHGADLRYADLQDANLDWSCWPLECGSLRARIDKRQAAQLAYHLASVLPEECKEGANWLFDFANSWEGIKKHKLPKLGRGEA